MKNKICLVSVILFFIIISLLILYPNIEINKDNKIIKFSYSDDISLFEDQECYNESYFYNKKRNISIYNYDFKKFLFFHIIIIEYKDGNVCDTEYLLEESYINDFINNAKIEHNEYNIDIAKLIEGKEAIVGNIKYLGNEYGKAIYYVLNGKHEVLYIFYVDNLLVIQVGYSDEGPKYIAYK